MDDNSKYTGAYADLLTQVAENVEAVYAAGVKSEYDRFWDAYQQNGERRNYFYAFAGIGWTDENFYPKYDIVNVGANYYWFQYSKITNLKKRLEECGVVLDTSQTGYALGWFSDSEITDVPTLSLQGSNTCVALTRASKLRYVEKLITEPNGTCKFPNKAFENCISLEHIIFEGVIGQNIDLHWSTKLTHESLMSIINALKDYSGSGSTYTCTLGEANLAKLTDAEKAIATEKGWTLA